MDSRKWMVVAVAVVLMMPLAAQAVTYDGQLSYSPPAPAGVDDTAVAYPGGSEWPGCYVSITYQVTDEHAAYPDLAWRYAYTVTVFNPSGTTQSGISHVILETSPSFTAGDLAGLYGASLDSIGLHETGPGNFEMPEDVYGIKFNPPADDLIGMSWLFYSDRSPVPGDIYVKGGGGNGSPDVAWNAGFTGPDLDLPDDYHVLVPDTNTTGDPPGGHAPEPVTVLGVLLGMGGLAGYCRRRFM